jgi:hypothetical protein
MRDLGFYGRENSSLSSGLCGEDGGSMDLWNVYHNTRLFRITTQNLYLSTILKTNYFKLQEVILKTLEQCLFTQFLSVCPVLFV